MIRGPLALLMNSDEYPKSDFCRHHGWTHVLEHYFGHNLCAGGYCTGFHLGMARGMVSRLSRCDYLYFDLSAICKQTYCKFGEEA